MLPTSFYVVAYLYDTSRLEPRGSHDVSTSDERWAKLDDLYEPPLSHPWGSRSRPILWYSGDMIRWSNLMGNPTVTVGYYQLGAPRT